MRNLLSLNVILYLQYGIISSFDNSSIFVNENNTSFFNEIFLINNPVHSCNVFVSIFCSFYKLFLQKFVYFNINII